MTTQQLLLLHRASPFRPFVIFLDDGRTMDVANVECFGLGEDGFSFTLFEPPHVLNVLDPAHVVSVLLYESKNLRR